VLYNGVEPYPDEAVINLSDAFADTEILGLPTGRSVDLESRVKVEAVAKLQLCNSNR
jgi:hypothetical protein